MVFLSSTRLFGAARLAVALTLSGSSALFSSVPRDGFDRAAAIASEMARGDGSNVLVVAHRSDWRNHPENSLAAMRSAIALGVDVIECDVRRTKDGRFVILHDPVLDRSTTGSGPVAECTLEELGKLRLRDGLGVPTEERIPRLEEALEVARGRVVINLDKSFEHPAEILHVVEKAGALNYVLFSVTQSIEEFESSYPGVLERMKHVMLVVGGKAKNPGALISGYLRRKKIEVLQVTFESEDSAVFAEAKAARGSGVRLWMNSLWPNHNAGHADDRALSDPEGAYGWLVDQGATLIQTDRPALLMEYLRRRGVRR